MGRYALVASYYNRRTKKYEKEMLINIEGYDFSKLHEIDRFTLFYSNLEMSDIIRKQNDVGDRNFVSIRYVKSDGSFGYYRVINDNKELLSCVNDLVLEYGLQGKYTYSIKGDNSFFQKEKDKLIDLIESRNYQMLDVLTGNSKHLKYLIDKYLNSYYEDSEYNQKRRDMDNIISEFSRYKVFRGWIVNNMKLSEKRIFVDNNNDLESKERSNNKKKSSSQFKYKKLSDKDFVVDRDKVLRDYNEGYEEFLDDRELDEMGIVSSLDDSMEMFGDTMNGFKKRRK